ncbi:hypothetical protein VNO78_03498 [Psophocarpus tetragonolobus]|uniref:Uncharacterized protein n=1 Tax=Psophocarpus tetragonolobus TaxID=3891 RepID=A0AAN9XWR4_PSOTE
MERLGMDIGQSRRKKTNKYGEVEVTILVNQEGATTFQFHKIFKEFRGTCYVACLHKVEDGKDSEMEALHMDGDLIAKEMESNSGKAETGRESLHDLILIHKQEILMHMRNVDLSVQQLNAWGGLKQMVDATMLKHKPELRVDIMLGCEESLRIHRRRMEHVMTLQACTKTLKHVAWAI